MSKKDSFIKVVSEIFNEDCYCENWMSKDPAAWEDAVTYWKAFQGGTDKDKPAFTKNGKLILQYMIDNKDTYNNLFKAKDIGEGLNITSRTASGAMRKLVTDGYLEKMGESPVTYSLTEKGISVNFNEE